MRLFNILLEIFPKVFGTNLQTPCMRTEPVRLDMKYCVYFVNVCEYKYVLLRFIRCVKVI